MPTSGKGPGIPREEQDYVTDIITDKFLNSITETKDYNKLFFCHVSS